MLNNHERRIVNSGGLRQIMPMPETHEEEYGSIRVRAAGRDWTLLRPADLESLWEAMTDEEFTADERLPYWVELWPASIALCDWLLERRGELGGRTCLDMGCGLGLSALVAHSFGARVVGMDYEKAALKFASLNAAENGPLNGFSGEPAWAAVDWRVPAFRRGVFDFIWGGDIMYERRFVTPVLDCLEYSLVPGGRVWLAEPNRNVYDDFRAALLHRGWRSAKVYSGEVDPLRAQKSRVGVSLWELTLS